MSTGRALPPPSTASRPLRPSAAARPSSCRCKDGQLELSVTNPDHGTASEELAVEFEPESFEIGFNARYLLDIIGQIRSDNAVFLFNDAGSPTLVREDGDAKALYVLMPMRV